MNSLSPKSTRHADIIVIGAGVFGTFHAYFATHLFKRQIAVVSFSSLTISLWNPGVCCGN
jgi:hypothetical protein